MVEPSIDPASCPPLWEADFCGPDTVERAVSFAFENKQVESKNKNVVEPEIDSKVLQKALDMLVDPITGSPSKGKTVVGIVSIHVDDLFYCGNDDFIQYFSKKIRDEYVVGPEDYDDILFCWPTHTLGQQGWT